MNETTTAEVTAGRLTSTSVVAVTVDHEAPAAAVAQVMIENGCDAVPVVTSAGALVGLVTSTDLVTAVAAGSVAVEPGSPAEWHDGDHG